MILFGIGTLPFGIDTFLFGVDIVLFDIDTLLFGIGILLFDTDTLLFGIGILLFGIRKVCHTADNYFSPVLAVICDLLDMPPEVAGVTFLAFGNGAPDVFAAIVALTTATDKESALLVGVASLLGSSVMTVTVVVGSVVYVASTVAATKVPPASFTRDVVFLFLALLLMLGSAYAERISGPGAGRAQSASDSQEGLEVGGLASYGSDGSLEAVDSNVEHARWIPSWETPSKPGGTAACATRGSSPTTPDVLNATQGSTIPRDKASTKINATIGGQDPEAGEGKDEFSSCGHRVKNDFFGGGGGDDEEAGEEEERSLLGRSGRDAGGGAAMGGGRGSTGGEEAWGLGGDVRSMVPGSTVSMFLEEDDSVASWLAQRQMRRWGGGGRLSGMSAYGAGTGRVGGAMTEPLLAVGDGSQIGSQKDPRNGSRSGFSGSGFSTNDSSFSSRCSRQADDLYGDSLETGFSRRRCVRAKVVKLRHEVIPVRACLGKHPVEAMAIKAAFSSPDGEHCHVGTALAPTLIVWAFGLWGSGFLGAPGGFSWGVVAFLVGIPLGVAVALTTHKRRMPRDRLYRLGLALVAFVSCVAWIYYLANLAVMLIEDIGEATGLPSSVLGLSFLAWGNCAGDWVTNLAVAKAGYPGMAIAGSYGGPLFNLLLGIGLPMEGADTEQKGANAAWEGADTE
eukprot:jgi/Undpi1/2903/HiC_scaffold_14.g06280.m1